MILSNSKLGNLKNDHNQQAEYYNLTNDSDSGNFLTIQNFMLKLTCVYKTMW